MIETGWYAGLFSSIPSWYEDILLSKYHTGSGWDNPKQDSMRTEGACVLSRRRLSILPLGIAVEACGIEGAVVLALDVGAFYYLVTARIHWIDFIWRDQASVTYHYEAEDS